MYLRKLAPDSVWCHGGRSILTANTVFEELFWVDRDPGSEVGFAEGRLEREAEAELLPGAAAVGDYSTCWASSPSQIGLGLYRSLI